MHAPRAMRTAALLLSMLAAAPQPTKKTPFVIMPVHADKPPPQDPTLLRLTRELAEAVHDAVQVETRVVSREERDQRCPQEDGACPADIADFLDGERAISFALVDNLQTLVMRVYRGTYGVEREAKIPCQWDEGKVTCELDKLPVIFEEKSAPDALKEGEAEATFAKLQQKLAKCRALDKEPPPAEAWITFRVRPDGHVFDVRVEPRELGDRRGFQCIATTVESMRTRKFSGEPQSFRLNLLPKPKEKPKKGKK